MEDLERGRIKESNASKQHQLDLKVEKLLRKIIVIVGEESWGNSKGHTKDSLMLLIKLDLHLL